MKDGGGSESGEIGENVPFPLLSLREKKGYIYRSSTKARWLDRCCGPGMAFKHKRFAAVPVQSRVNVFRRLADAGRGGGGGGGGGGEGGRKEACPREFAAIVPAIFPSHSNGLYTRTHTRTFRAREHLADDAEPSRADANVFTATAYSNSWKKNNREKERKKEFVPGFYSERGRVIACRSVIAKLPSTDFRDRFDRYRPT